MRHDLVTVPPLCRESWRMDDDVARAQLVNPFFTGGETISVSYPDQRDDPRAEDDEHARQQHPLLPRHGPPRADPRPPPPVLHDVPVQGLPPPVQHAVLGRRLGALLGAAALGRGLPEVAREQGRHAVLADAPLRPDHLLAGLPPGEDDARGVHRLPGRSGRPRARQRHRPRSAAPSPRRTVRSIRRPICSAASSSVPSIASWSSRAR